MGTVSGEATPTGNSELEHENKDRDDVMSDETDIDNCMLESLYILSSRPSASFVHNDMSNPATAFLT